MKLKAVIFREDRTNDVVIPKKKEVEGKSFRHDGSIYFINPDHVQITWTRTWLVKKNYFATSYYTRGISNPLPVPDFKRVEEQVRDEKGNLVFDAEGKPVVQQIFPKIIDNGVPGEELAAIFNPWFYRIIAALKASLLERIQFLMIIGILLMQFLLAYLASTNEPPSAEEIANAIIAAQQEQQTPPPQGGAGGL